MGRWIRRGYYPSWILRLFRHRRGALRRSGRQRTHHRAGRNRPVAQRFHARGSKGRHRVDRQAQRLRHARGPRVVEATGRHRLSGDRCPPVRRSVATQALAAYRRSGTGCRPWSGHSPIFSTAMFSTGGFLDGTSAFMYHFLQALWFLMLVDIKYIELKRRPRHGKLPAIALWPASSTDQST